MLFPAVILIRLGFPPFDLAPATLAGWAILIQYVSSPDRRPRSVLGGLWLAGFLWNLSMTYYITYPHWATSIGWLVLSAYLAVYWSVWGWVCRCGLQLKLPLWLVAPIAWTGLELVEGHLLSGFLLNQQALLFYRVPALVQIAEFTGCYGVSFIVILLAGLIADAWNRRANPLFLFVPLLCFAVVFLAGQWRLYVLENAVSDSPHFVRTTNSNSSATTAKSEIPALNIALIQGDVWCQVEADVDLAQKTFQQYNPLTYEALRKKADIPTTDVVIWPECMFRYPIWELGTVPPEPEPELDFQGTPEQYVQDVKKRIIALNAYLPDQVRFFNVNFITGIDRCVLSGKNILRYNSAVCVSPAGKINSVYDKQHRVLFGEYIPFADKISWLNQVTPIGSGTQAGQNAQVFVIKTKNNGSLLNLDTSDSISWALLPSICYENTLPQVIRKQIIDVNQPIDALINLSNDGWFRGGFENELRLGQAVFRAVETRRDNLIASNGGISAQVNSVGRIIQQGEKNIVQGRTSGVKQQVLYAQVRKTNRDGVSNRSNPQKSDGTTAARYSFYTQWGDWFSSFCLLISAIIGGYPLLRPAKLFQTEK